MENLFKKIHLIYSILLAFVCFLGMAILGSWFEYNFYPLPKIIPICLSAVFIVVVVFNLFFINFKPKTLNLIPREHVSLKKETIKIYTIISLYFFYITAIVLLCLAIIFFSFACTTLTYHTFFSALGFYGLVGFFVKLISKKKQQPLKFFNKQEIPNVCEIIENRLAKFKIKSKWEIVITDHTEIMIFYRKRTLVFVLGIEAICLLTKEELKNLLNHEFSRIVNKPLRRHQTTIPIVQRFKMPFNLYQNFIQSWLIYPSLMLEKYYTKYHAFTKPITEQNADLFAKQHSEAKEYINGLAKLELFELNSSIPVYKFLGEDEPTKKYWQIIFSSFIEELETNRENYEYVLDHRLAMFYDPHPSFASRRQLFGVVNYNYFSTESDEKYIEEQQKLTEILNQNCYNNALKNFKESKQYYTEKLQKIDELQKSPLSISHPEFVMRNIELAECLIETNKEDQALNLLNFLIEKCNSGKASLIKANVLNSHCDRECIKCYLHAIDEDLNSRHTSLNLLAESYAKYGMINEMQNMGQFAKEKIEELKIFNRGPNFIDNLCPTTLTTEWFDKNLENILSIWENDIDEIYLVCQKVTPKHVFNCYLLKPKNGVDEQIVHQKHKKTFEYLDNTYDDFFDKSVNNYYSLNMISSLNPTQIENINKVEGSLIYKNKN